MTKPREVQDLQTIEELTRLFADAAEDPLAASFDGVEFEIVRGTDTGPGRAGLAAPFGSHGEGHRSAHALRLELPRPAVAEMSLAIGKSEDPQTGELRVGWDLQAGDEAAAREYLAGGLEDVLRRLGERYGIQIDDRTLALGPLLGTPAQTARDVADLIAALPRPDADAPAVPDFDEAAAAGGGMVEAGVYASRVDADLARGALEASGIPARTAGSTGGGLFGDGFGGGVVQVLVPRSFADQAEQVLAELDKEDDGAEEADDPHERRYGGGPEDLRRPDRLALLEVERVIDLSLTGATCKSVVDVGTGGGVFAEAFLRRGLRVAGCDVNAAMLESARAQVPGAEFKEGAAEELPYADGAFDLVFLGLVLHEVDDVPSALAEARRVARVRAAILEWPYREEEQGPPLAFRLRPDDVASAARDAGFARVERIELKRLVLFLLTAAE